MALVTEIAGKRSEDRSQFIRNRGMAVAPLGGGIFVGPAHQKNPELRTERYHVCNPEADTARTGLWTGPRGGAISTKMALLTELSESPRRVASRKRQI